MKHLRYLRYLLVHKWFVLVACWREGLYWRGLVHDLSKLRPSEWFPYADSFYGAWAYADRPPFVVFRFDVAWLEHQHRNAHHWQYWVLREDDGATKRMQMSMDACREMLCDWYGAGRAIQGKSFRGWPSVQEWYEAQEGRQLLSDTTRRWVETFLANRTAT